MESTVDLSGKVVYSLVTQAYFVDKTWGHGTPLAGMKRMGDLGHKHGVPLTYLVTGRSAQDAEGLLSNFHHDYGDAVGLMLEFPDIVDENGHKVDSIRHYMQRTQPAQLREHLQAEIAAVKESLPWAEIKVVGTGYRSSALANVLEDLGIPGLYGYCVWQVGTDEITDFGCPWGQWYVDRANFKRPAQDTGSVVALEWTARDLNKSFHYLTPENYSTDPNDVEAEFKCTDTDVDYWKTLLDDYRRNLQYNDAVYFLQHQEAHEMEATQVCRTMTERRVHYCTLMMDLFLMYVKSCPDVACVTLNDAVDYYRQKNQGVTPPTLIHARDIPIATQKFLNKFSNPETARGSLEPKHIWISFNDKLYRYIDRFVKQDCWQIKPPPWEDSIFYYDRECLMVIDESRREPVWLENFAKKDDPADEYFMGMEEVPEFNHVEETTTEDIIEYKYWITVPEDLPYGFVEWLDTDFTPCKIREHTGIDAWWMPNMGVFMRINLHAGENNFSLALTREK